MKLIYVMDPLCGWCYGNYRNTLQTAERYKDSIPFEIIPAGMWAGQNIRKQSKQMAAYFIRHDEQIASLTGTAFGADYFKFISQHEVVLDSEIPSRAILTVQQFWPEKNVAFAAAVQKERYFYGKDLNLDLTYQEMLDALGIEKELFFKHFHDTEMKAVTQDAFAKAADYAMSYPTLLLDTGSELLLIEQGYSPLEEIFSRIESHLSVKY